MMTIDLSRRVRRRLALLVIALNLIFTAGMVAFLYYWPQRDYFGPRGRAFVDHVLVQFHLGAENVVAAWYSSMLLLLVAVVCVMAYALDRRHAHGWFRRTLAMGWLPLAAAFTVLSLDEVGSIHERVGMSGALATAVSQGAGQPIARRAARTVRPAGRRVGTASSIPSKAAHPVRYFRNSVVKKWSYISMLTSRWITLWPASRSTAVNEGSAR